MKLLLYKLKLRKLHVYFLLSIFSFSSLHANEKLMKNLAFDDEKTKSHSLEVLATSSLQQVTVSGTLTNSTGEPLIGASVSVKGTNTGAITDIDGKYKIVVPSSDATLVFTYVGYLAEERQVGNLTTIDLVMAEDLHALNEVVVTALGIKREKKALGYAMSSVSGDELVKSSDPVNPLMSLYGKAAGVRISSTSGGPTAGMIINIRNSVSLTQESSTRPLFVVDGIPIFDENTGSTRNDRDGRDRGTGINDINADDIESIDILKGAKAAVLYGYKGANGVVLITTKSGKKGKGIGIEASTSYTVDNIAYYPKYQNEFGSGGNIAYMGIDPMLSDAQGFQYKLVNGVKTPVFWASTGTSFGPKMDGRDILWYDGVMRPYTPQPDNYKQLFQTGHLRTSNFSISNGGELGNFRFSYTNKDYKGIALSTSQTNHNLSFSGNLKAIKRVDISFASNYYYTFNHNAPFRVQDGFVTYGVPRDLKTDLLKNNLYDQTGIYSFFRNKEYTNNAGGIIANSIFGDYIWNQTQNNFDETRHHFVQSVKIDAKLTNWMSLVMLGGFDYTHKSDLVEKKVTRPISEPLGGGEEFKGYYSVYERSYMNMYTQAYLSFDKAVGSDFRINGLAGGVYADNRERGVKAVTKNFLVENWFSFGNSTDVIKTSGEGYRAKDLLYSLMASAQIAYKEDLFLELQGRNDWSSILPPSNNNYFYPGASVAWVASQALHLPAAIKFAKLRFSWADVGRPGPRYFGNLNFDVSSYGNVPYMTSNSSLPPADFANANGKLPAENLKPERKREFELGLEMNFLKDNRIGIDLSVYKSNVYDQIMSLTVPPASGVSSIKVNAGDIQHTGLEIQLKGTPVLVKDFSWNNTLNLSFDKTKINKLAKGVTVQALWGITGAKAVAAVGGQYGEVTINRWARDANDNLLVSTDGLYMPDKTKDVSVGTFIPKGLGGFNSNFNYKGITLDMDFDFQFGGIMISQTNMYLKGNGTGASSLQYRDEARGGLPYYVDNNKVFHKLDFHADAPPAASKYSFIFHDGVILPGVKADGTKNDILIPAEKYYESTYWQSFYDITEDMIFKSDYLSLRRITLSYQLPRKWSNKMLLQNVRVAAFAMNVAYLYKAVPNVTPESFSGTNEFTEYANMPGIRTFGFEVKLGF
jgi:TonB-linked SusC/RagA family outer membrane protein